MSTNRILMVVAVSAVSMYITWRVKALRDLVFPTVSGRSY
jgi:hypothetical protein